MTRNLPIPYIEIVCALERDAAGVDTDPRWLAACELRRLMHWRTRSLMCRVVERDAESVSTTTEE